MQFLECNSLILILNIIINIKTSMQFIHMLTLQALEAPYFYYFRLALDQGTMFIIYYLDGIRLSLIMHLNLVVLS